MLKNHYGQDEEWKTFQGPVAGIVESDKKLILKKEDEARKQVSENYLRIILHTFGSIRLGQYPINF